MSSDKPIGLDLPITTGRLVLRAAVPADAGPLHHWRNKRSVWELEAYAVPFPMERAEAIVEGSAAMVGPTPGEWWLLILEAGPGQPGAGDPIGELAVRLDDSGTVAELGYTLDPDHWGRGYATEATAAVIDAILSAAQDLVRIEARMHPDNLASTAVAERCGFRYEGRTRLSFPPRHSEESHTDDVIYGLTRTDHAEWADRPEGHPAEVALVEVTNDNLRAVFDLATHKSQERLVAPVARSLAQALHPPLHDGIPVEPWHRAVEADGEIVGFVMMGFRPGRPPYLWRMLIDRRHQRRGIGRRVLDLIVAEVRDRGADELAVSWVPGRGSPEPFYLGYGFRPSGEADEYGEIPGILSI